MTVQGTKYRSIDNNPVHKCINKNKNREWKEISKASRDKVEFEETKSMDE